MREELKPLEFIKHFKHNMLPQEEKDKKKHIYCVVAVNALVQSSNGSVPECDKNGEPMKMCVYRMCSEPYLTFVRPMSEMYDKVDKEKYPEAEQELRFEKLKTGEKDL